MLQLTIHSPETEAGQSCSISGSSVTIGRNRLNDLCLSDGTVSDFHAEIVPDGHGGWKINDHDSSNGTFLNGAKIKSKAIRSGDNIAFGGVASVVEAAKLDLDDDLDLEVPPAVAVAVHPPEEIREDRLPNSSLPTAQIEQAIAMHQARVSGKVDTVGKVPAEVTPVAEAKDTATTPSGDVAEMHDRLKHALNELQALKDKHALQTRELEKYQERADLLEDPDADVTRLRIKMSDIKRKCDDAERKLMESDKEVARLKKQSATGASAAKDTGISPEDHEAAVKAAAEKEKVAGEKRLARQIEDLCKQHRVEIKELKKQHSAQTSTKQSDRSEVESLEKRIEELIAESEKQQSAQQAQGAELEKREAQIAAKEVEVKKLSASVAELQGTVENLQGDDATRSDEVAKLSTEREEQLALVKKRETELAELNALHEAAADELREVEAERDEAKATCLKTSNELQEARSTVEDHAEKEATLQQRIAELESQLEQSDEQTQADNAKLIGELESSGAENAALHARLEESAKKITGLEEEVAEHEAEVVAKVAALSVLQEELSEKEKSISAAVETESELQAAAAEREKTIVELRAEIETLSGESGDVSEQLSESRSKIESLNEELATLKREQAEVGAAGKIVEKLESEAETLRANLEELNQEREQMRSDLDAERIALDRERVAIDAERVSLQETLKESQKQAAAAGEKLKNAEQEVEAKRHRLESELEELESEVIIERQRLEALTGKAEAAEERARKASELVEVTAQRWDKAEADATREERRLAGLRRKLVRRRKLLEQLKGIGRREQALKRKIAEAQTLLRAAEEHKPGKSAPSVPRPWDVDRAVAEHEAMLQRTRELEERLAAKRAEWEKIDRDVQAGRGPLGDEAKEIDLEEFSAAIARVKELESIVERFEIEKQSLIDTVSMMKAKIAAAGAGAQGSVVP